MSPTQLSNKKRKRKDQYPETKNNRAWQQKQYLVYIKKKWHSTVYSTFLHMSKFSWRPSGIWLRQAYHLPSTQAVWYSAIISAVMFVFSSPRRISSASPLSISRAVGSRSNKAQSWGSCSVHRSASGLDSSYSVPDYDLTPILSPGSDYIWPRLTSILLPSGLAPFRF